MDGAQDGLPVIRQLPQEPDNIPRALAIEARSGFIQEEEQLWFAGELHTNRHSFPCLASKAQYQSVGERLEFEEFDDFFHVSVLLGLGNLIRLAQISREPHRFSDRCRTLVDIHLLGYFQVPVSPRIAERWPQEWETHHMRYHERRSDQAASRPRANHQ